MAYDARGLVRWLSGKHESDKGISMGSTYGRISKENTIITLIFGLLIFLSTVFFFFHWPTIRPVTGTTDSHYYLAQQISNGHLLYRDLFSDKPPLTEYIGALCFLIYGGKVLPAIILARFVFFGFFVLSAIPLFIISKHALGKIHLALLVILVYLSFNYPYIRIARGSDWHILMNFFGLLSVAFVLKNRYVLSGLFSSLAALSWAPGIVFFFATLFTVMLFPNDKRKGELWKVVLGFLLPILLLLSHMHVNGSLSDFIKQAILFGEINIRVGFLAGIAKIPSVINQYYSRNIPVIVLGTSGFIINLVQITRGGYNKPNSKARILALFLLSMTILYSLIDFQGGYDFISFIPWLAFYAVHSITFFPVMTKSLVMNAVSICFILCLIGHSLIRTIEEPPSVTLKEQRETTLNELRNFDLTEDDLLLCMQPIYPLLFLNKRNLVKHLHFLTWKHYVFIQKYEKNGFDSILRTIDEKKPKLVCVRKRYLRKIACARRYRKLKKLLEVTYEKFEGREMAIFVRK